MPWLPNAGRGLLEPRVALEMRRRPVRQIVRVPEHFRIWLHPAPGLVSNTGQALIRGFGWGGEAPDYAPSWSGSAPTAEISTEIRLPT